MQLKSIRGCLASATCTLLGVTLPPDALPQASTGDWNMDSAVLIYAEKGRVSATEPVISLRKDLGDDEFINLRLVADVLTGASPNGAVPASVPQTFTGPSGGSRRYTTSAGQMPLDPTFSDKRIALSLSKEKPLNRLLKRILAANFSVEQDYLSMGLSATYNKDLDNKLTTLTAGAALNLDFVSPVGGKPPGLSEMSAATTVRRGDDDEEEGEDGESDAESKLVTDLLFGVTRVLNRKTLMQLNVGIGRSGGYLTDPYKLLSVVDAVNGEPVVGSGGDTFKYMYEKRPDTRLRRSIYWKLNHQFTHDVVYVSYRYYKDDWGVDSHTLDLRYRLELGRRHYLQPHIRYYRQSAAYFHRYFLLENAPLPSYASADYRLGELSTETIGLQYGMKLNGQSVITLRIEKIAQSGEGHPSSAVGSLRRYNLFPGLDATAIQASFKYRF